VSPDRPSALSTVARVARDSVAFAADLGLVAWVLPRVEHGRRNKPAGPLLDDVRAEGRARGGRSERSRARLARAIRWVDRLGPGGPNCLRRTLLAVALDPDAAREPVVFGLNVRAKGDPTQRSPEGHAWVNETEASGRFDVEFRV
jgi:hypothetical protein